VPSNVSALVLRAPTGSELSCRTQSRKFTDAGVTKDRGLVSYYALRALAEATTMESWLTRTMSMCKADVDAGRLPATLAVSLAVTGDSGWMILGTSGRGN
jgi:hypothetical protein